MNSKALITVALMTRNRSHYLRLAMNSILAQQGVELQVIVFDNASSDDTPAVVRGFNDPRVEYQRSETDIGIMRNWNRAIDVAKERSPFVSIFHDDDIMLPGFLSESVRALEENPTAGICVSITELIDQDGTPTKLLHGNDVKPGLNKSLDFIELMVTNRSMLILPPIGIFRSEVLKRIGPADSPHTRATCDMNHWMRAALDSDVYFLPKLLTQYRSHAGSDTELIQQVGKTIGWYGNMAEQADGLAYLLMSDRAADPKYRQWLAERLLWTHAHQSECMHPLVEQMYHSPENRLAMFLNWVSKFVPPGERYMLVDDMQLGLSGTIDERRIVPFVESNGEYWGHPRDAQHAIDEVERLRATGVHWLVVAWPSHWWLDAYPEFARHLRERYKLARRFPHGFIFDLREVNQGM